MATAVQLDLFATASPAPEPPSRLEVVQAVTAEWAALFDRPRFRAAHDTTTIPAGQVAQAIRCPGCGGVEWTAAALEREHGWSLTVPRVVSGGCVRVAHGRLRQGLRLHGMGVGEVLDPDPVPPGSRDWHLGNVAHTAAQLRARLHQD